MLLLSPVAPLFSACGQPQLLSRKAGQQAVDGWVLRDELLSELL
jgi:hypothetical protein